MLIIDFHTHCFPDAIAPHAMATLSEHGGIPFYHNGTFSGLENVERAGGTDGFAVMPIATNAHQTPSVNRFAAEIQNPARHVFAFGSIHPDNADYKEQLHIIKALGLHGVKLHPEYQEFHVDDERMFPIYEEIFRLGLPLLFHAGEDIGFRPPWHAEPYKLAKVAEKFPEGTIIAAHMGGFRMWREAAEILPQFPNVCIDTSFSAELIPTEEFRSLCAKWGPERILFGTDSPWSDVAGSLEAVRRLIYPERDMDLIFSGNAMRILGMK